MLEQCVSAFPSLCCSRVTLVTEQRAGIRGGVVVQRAGVTIPWGSLFSFCNPDLGFLGLFS